MFFLTPRWKNWFCFWLVVYFNFLFWLKSKFSSQVPFFHPPTMKPFVCNFHFMLSANQFVQQVFHSHFEPLLAPNRLILSPLVNENLCWFSSFCFELFLPYLFPLSSIFLTEQADFWSVSCLFIFASWWIWLLLFECTIYHQWCYLTVNYQCFFMGGGKFTFRSSTFLTRLFDLFW